MTITDFDKNYRTFTNMAVWEIQNLDHFFEDDEMLTKIFQEEYGFPYSEFEQHKDVFKDTPVMVVSKVLDYFGDKYFFVFEYGNKHHNDLKMLQDKKIINFGMDIHVIHPMRIYVLMMDRSTDPANYDTV